MPAITFQSVDNEYEWGTYFDLNVLIMSRNGYMNATKLCQDGGKRFDNWLRNQGSKDLINEFESAAINVGDGRSLTILITGGNNPEYRGTYADPDLITHIASWVSAKLALKVSKIVNEYIKRDQRKIIDKQATENMSLNEMIHEMREESRRSSKQNAELIDKLSKLSLDNQITHKKLDIAQDTLNIVVEDRVV